MMNGQGESAGRFSQESEATVKKYNASGPKGPWCEFNLHNLWKKNPVLYVPALPSVGRQTASALRGGRGEVQVTGTSQAPCRDSEPQQPRSLLQPSCWQHRLPSAVSWPVQLHQHHFCHKNIKFALQFLFLIFNHESTSFSVQNQAVSSHVLSPSLWKQLWKPGTTFSIHKALGTVPSLLAPENNRGAQRSSEQVWGCFSISSRRMIFCAIKPRSYPGRYTTPL